MKRYIVGVWDTLNRSWLNFVKVGLFSKGTEGEQ